MKKYFVGLLFGVFLLFGGMDVHALEIDQVINGINSKQFSEDLLKDLNANVSAAYNCDGSTSTCDSTTAHQFNLVFTYGEGSELSMSAITYDFTDEYISYTTKTTGLGDYSLEDEVLNMYGLAMIMDTVARQHGHSIPYDRDPEGITYQYAEDGLEIEEFSHTGVSGDGTITLSGMKSVKINYRDGFAGAIEKMNNAPIRKEDSEDEPSEVTPGDGKDDENKKDENDQKDDFTVTPIDTEDDSEKIVNPSTGDLNLPVIAGLGIVAILGVGVSFKKIHG